MFKWKVASTAFIWGVALPACADIIFADSFTRRSSNTVGAPLEYPSEVWRETNRQTNDVAIVRGRLQLRDRGATAAQLDLSTAGFENIVLSYRWAPLAQSDPTDRLLVRWNDGTGLVTLATHQLCGRGNLFQSNSISFSSLASYRSDVEIRFTLVVNAPNEGALIDNVLVSGDRIAITAIPEPSVFAVMLAGLTVLASVVRRKNR